ncbi:MAG: hypothetical protein GXP19_05010 [Gammaproteobacteria bacterium]|nr:hypothetical protein [Gammaproteobacteria bacterium]
MNKNISPHIYVLCTLFVVAATVFFFKHYGFKEQYFYIPIFLLGIIYAIINFVRQQRGLSEFSVDKKTSLATLVKKAVARYIVWLAFIYLAYTFFRLEPFYSSPTYRPNSVFFEYFLDIYLVVGLPYFILTSKFKASRTEDYYDPAIRIIHILKQILLRTLRGDNTHSIFKVFRKKYNRKVLLTFLMRTYFIPIMVVQVYNNTLFSLNFPENSLNNYQLLSVLFWISALLWLADTLNASLSYCIESRWMENRTRSIDLTFAGWAVCLMCYAPLNEIPTYFFFFAPFVVTNNESQLIIENIDFLYAIKITEILLLAVHIYIDISLGPSVANITLKKLQTKGFYGLIRHPGTTLKLLFWLIQSVFYKRFWNLKVIFGYLMWGTIYVLRALTEERHLNQHKEYREYKKKVKYRFIPKIL